MSKWQTIFNDFFWLTFSQHHKIYRLSWFWKGRIYQMSVSFNLHTTNLVDDGKYNSERERYAKNGFGGLAEPDEQRPHLKGEAHERNCQEYARRFKKN